MQCDDVARVLPAVVDGDATVDLFMQRHIESCLRCQAELARYRKMLRGLQLLRTRYLEPAPGLFAQTLAAIEAERGPRALRSAAGASRTPARSAVRRWRLGDRGRGDRAPHPSPRAPATS